MMISFRTYRTYLFNGENHKYYPDFYGIEFWEELYEDNPNNNIEHLKATRKFLWLNNGSENVFITPDKYDEYIKAGYVRGRIS